MVALTFDDGPDPEGTPLVLDALARAGARATFFVLGERVECEPALLERVLAEGHDVQVHGYGHPRHPEHSRDAIERDLEAALAALAKHGLTPSLWRLPYGEPATFSAAIAAEHGLRLVRWTVDSYDWRGDKAPDMLVALQPELREHAIVLMHDGAGCARETAALVGPLIEAIRAKGLETGAGSSWQGANPFDVGAGQAMDSGGDARGGVGGARRGAGCE